MSNMICRKVLIFLGVAITLLAVFMSYHHPDLILTLANQLWNCF
jgi:hypothetical protein